MDIDRETLLEVVISTASVLVMIAAMAFIGMTYSNDDEISSQGGTVFVGVIVVFVFLMMAIGYWLANYKAGQGGDGDGKANGA